MTLDMLRDLVRPNITGDGSARAVATSARTLADVVEDGHGGCAGWWKPPLGTHLALSPVSFASWRVRLSRKCRAVPGSARRPAFGVGVPPPGRPGFGIGRYGLRQDPWRVGRRPPAEQPPGGVLPKAPTLACKG